MPPLSYNALISRVILIRPLAVDCQNATWIDRRFDVISKFDVLRV
jgi:hypothetical protein